MYGVNEIVAKFLKSAQKWLAKALVRRAIFTSNIAIKRYNNVLQYFDKAIFFVEILLLLFKISWNNRELRFPIHTMKKNIAVKNVFLSYYLNVFLSFYSNIACENRSSDEGLRQFLLSFYFICFNCKLIHYKCVLFL